MPIPQFDVRKKLSLHLSTDSDIARLTLVDVPVGYILKPQTKEYEKLPEAEFLVMKMAEEVGIKVVPCALVRMDGSYAYITKRIDRLGDTKLAMEDFCQISERLTEDKYKSSYEVCGKIVKRLSKNTMLDMSELFLRLVFCFLVGNSDMHLKNFSLIEDAPKSRNYELAAAYDLLPVNIIMPSDIEEMALTMNGRKRKISKRDFMQLADYVSFRTKESDSQDGGNALFAALEYWNGGFVYNGKRNAVAMLKKYQQKFHNVNHDGE